MRAHQLRFIIAVLTVPLGAYTLFVVYPYIWAFGISFTEWRGLSAPPTWVGLDNFALILADAGFWNALGNNGIYLALVPVITVSLALALAVLICQRVTRLTEFYRVVFLFPQVMSVVVVAILWGYVFHPRIGLLNTGLDLVGINGPAWLGDPNLARGSLIAVIVWNSVGFHTALFIAAMRAIPETYFEAARLDGAGNWQMFRHITLPLMRDPVRTSLMFMAFEAFDLFAITRIMTGGGPNHTTDVLATYVYDQAFSFSRFGYASALAVVMFLIMLGFSAAMLLLFRESKVEFG
jgi:N-acetylglucosamine transport system permease protein